MIAAPTWRKSSHSGGVENECVENADLNDHIGIRDSKNPTGGHLTVTRQDFAPLLNYLTSVR
ncbi:DUF397 domain-containing protein [Actinomadura madurae]|uniref:DUF397 domain-containing protein n=1 Tax=Actinomadura madurae TaxID=1993 RepID=A0A1I4Z2I6_9ACTN|nr:DUF397 domain-containing protein [Actinomadura madurae]SFN44110.1 protein of unknown function [Actinomadura madurae]SPT49646.1 Domain of uncharacterised function (DUF397) [Actinomadura madurae]